MVFILKLPNNSRLVKKEWVEQEFKDLIFEPPSKLTFEKKQLEISNQTKMMSEDLELFDDTEKNRVHSVLKATIKSERPSMESIFELLSNEL